MTKERVCFQCGKQMHYEEYQQMNQDYGYDAQWLDEIWNSPYVQLLCCACRHDKNEKWKKLL